MGIKGERNCFDTLSAPAQALTGACRPVATSISPCFLGLTALINDNAPKAIRQAEMKTLFGRKVAIDA